VKRLLILLALAVAACSFLVATPPTAEAATSTGCQFRNAGPPPRVKSTPRAFRKSKTWIYGDSITWQSYRNLQKTLKGREAVDAYWGRNTTSAVNALRADIIRHRKYPKVVIMATGTNDLQDLNEFRRQVIRARHMLPKRVKLVWVNTYFDTADSYNAVNRALRSVPRVTVVNWSAVNVGHRVDGRSTLLYDGVHVTRLGCVLRNQAIKRAIR
jgi:lysophospholipase L1-like esterase